MNHPSDLLAQVDNQTLVDGLHQDQKVTFSENGNRALNPEDYLDHALNQLKKVGGTRVSEISGLHANRHFPVYQTCRPDLFSHSAFGQNSGGQGKGPSEAQAQISAIMETIEGFAKSQGKFSETSLTKHYRNRI